MKKSKRSNPIWIIPRSKFKQICQQSKSISEITRKTGVIGSLSVLRSICLKRIKEENIDISHIKRGFNWKKENSSIRQPKIKLSFFKKNSENKYTCPECLKTYSKHGICSHYLLIHGELNEHRPLTAHIKKNGTWNKGLTKENNESIQKQSETLKKRIEDGDVIPYLRGKTMPPEQRKKISDSMKKAHEDGRAWNIGQSRWNNEPSYPEKFFKKVIENDFIDKNYKQEFPLDRYSLDFAWVHLKKCIEIDGDQHQRFEEYQKRDKKKDISIKQAGWSVLRIKWKDFYHNPQKYIKIAYKFIHS